LGSREKVSVVRLEGNWRHSIKSNVGVTED
jgi:hypothetical protein